jgi:hypothetical protein
MKAVPNPVALRPSIAKKEMQAVCDNKECGYKDNFTKFYPIGRG